MICLEIGVQCILFLLNVPSLIMFQNSVVKICLFEKQFPKSIFCNDKLYYFVRPLKIEFKAIHLEAPLSNETYHSCAIEII